MNSLRDALSKRVVIADGAMGTMLQAQNPTLADFQNHEGCNEILNVTRPDIVKAVHSEYLAAVAKSVDNKVLQAQQTAADEQKKRIIALENEIALMGLSAEAARLLAAEQPALALQ